jgi:hypothetical protein
MKPEPPPPEIFHRGSLSPWPHRIGFAFTLGSVLIVLFCAVDFAGWMVADPTPGEVWQERDLFGRGDNPFREQRLETVRVVEVRAGWVKYVWKAHENECTVPVFKRLYHR